ncbi:MAG: hypothetical protein M3415_02035 [Actinomycetota bacterium]|nr:hypothetical protein [Actinomycetota bacterium]
MGGSGRQDDGAARRAGLSPTGLSEALEALALRGLADAAEGLLGSAPAAVCATFGRWLAAGERELPWLAGLCFAALAPVGAVAPRQHDAWVAGRLLVGAEHDEVRARSAAVGCRAFGALWATATVDGEEADRLLRAVQRFFTQLANGYAALHPLVLAGRHPQVVSAAHALEGRLDPVCAEIRQLALAVAALRPDLVAAPVRLEQSYSRPRPSEEPAAWRLPFAPRLPLAPRLSREPVWRTLLAVAFAAVALATACAVLWLVLHGWPGRTPSWR